MMNEGGGDTARDISGNNNHGALISMDASSWQPGEFGRCLDFDGAADIVQISSGSVPTALKMGTGSFTVSIWLTGTTANQAGAGRMFSVGTVAKRYSTFLNLSDGNCAFVIDDVANKTEVTFPYPTVLALHHLVCVRDRSIDKLIIYLDGVEKNSVTDNTETSIDEDTGANIGRLEDSAASFFDGLIHEVRVYKRAITIGEIHSLFTDPFLEFKQEIPFAVPPYRTTAVVLEQPRNTKPLPGELR